MQKKSRRKEGVDTILHTPRPDGHPSNLEREQLTEG